MNGSRTEQLAAFAAGTGSGSSPMLVHHAAAGPIVDSIAVMLAGLASEAGEAMLCYAQGSGDGPATIPGTTRRVAPDVCALVTATLGHALDYDDVFPGAGHPSVTILATILALGTSVDGGTALDAFVVGHEATVRVARALGPRHYARGWHNTCTAGSLGAACAAARLLGFDLQRTQATLGIVCSMAGGLQRNFGTMTKPLHSGLAARNGVMAASLVDAGMTAALDILDGPRGFLDIYGEGAARPDALDNLGGSYALVEPGPTLKKYPCCFATHRAIDAAFEIQAARAIPVEEIDSITCRVPPQTMMPLLYPHPETGLQGKFSMHYIVASALVDRHIDLATFSDAAVRRPAIERVAEKLTVIEDPACRPDDPQNLRSSIGSGGFVELTVRAGATDATAAVADASGSPSRALSWKDIEAKFRDCATSAGLTDERLDAAFSRLQAINEESSLSELLQTLLPA
jgi:2-methylcitrate dehydratase PrpD